VTLEDPEYLAKPFVHHLQLVHSPHLALYPSACDAEAARRFLPAK